MDSMTPPHISQFQCQMKYRLLLGRWQITEPGPCPRIPYPESPRALVASQLNTAILPLPRLQGNRRNLILLTGLLGRAKFAVFLKWSGTRIQDFNFLLWKSYRTAWIFPWKIQPPTPFPPPAQVETTQLRNGLPDRKAISKIRCRLVINNIVRF